MSGLRLLVSVVVEPIAYLKSIVSHGDPIPVGPDCEIARSHPANSDLEATGVVVAYSRAIWNQL